MAQYLDGAVEVTLRNPPPLNRDLTVEVQANRATLFDGATHIADAREAPLALEVPPAVTVAEASGTERRFPWKGAHPYPLCFVCGPARTPGDGLRIHPGLVRDRAVVAAVWTPDPTLGSGAYAAPEVVWAILDCPSYFGFAAHHASDEPVLLGRLHAELTRPVVLDEPCVIAGWFLERAGRKITAGSALWDPSGDLLARARATWIVLKN